MEIIAPVELKNHVADTRILSIVIPKFCHAQDTYLIVLPNIDKSTQISFHCAILPLGLTSSLQMKANEKLLLNAKKLV